MNVLKMLLAILAGVALVSACNMTMPRPATEPSPNIPPQPGASATAYVPPTLVPTGETTEATVYVPPAITPSVYVPPTIPPTPTQYVPNVAPPTSTLYLPQIIPPTMKAPTLSAPNALPSVQIFILPSATATTSHIHIPLPKPAGQIAIEAKYAALGGAGGFLGAPKEPVYKAPDGVGYYEYFQNGAIYWKPDIGAYEMHGLILAKWVELGWETSFLGYPITDESTTPGGAGQYNLFQGGSIYWTPDTGAHEIHGALRDKWASMGWEQGVLGFPTTDESGTPDGIGRYNHFQGGSIYWTAQTGAIPVLGQIRDKWASMGWEQSCLGYPRLAEEPGANGFRSQLFQGGKVFVYGDGSVKATCGFDSY